MKLEKFCEKDQLVLKTWYEENASVLDNPFKQTGPLPTVCRTCYYKMMAESIYEDIRHDDITFVKRKK